MYFNRANIKIFFFKQVYLSHLVAVDTLVRPLSGVDAHVFVETGRLGETLSAHRTLWIEHTG